MLPLFSGPFNIMEFDHDSRIKVQQTKITPKERTCCVHVLKGVLVHARVNSKQLVDGASERWLEIWWPERT